MAGPRTFSPLHSEASQKDRQRRKAKGKRQRHGPKGTVTATHAHSDSLCLCLSHSLSTVLCLFVSVSLCLNLSLSHSLTLTHFHTQRTHSAATAALPRQRRRRPCAARPRALHRAAVSTPIRRSRPPQRTLARERHGAVAERIVHRTGSRCCSRRGRSGRRHHTAAQKRPEQRL